jgi:hypothetical protein
MSKLTVRPKDAQGVEPSFVDRPRNLDIAISVDYACRISLCLTTMAGLALRELLRGCNRRLLGPLSQRSQEEKLEMHPPKRHQCHRHQFRHSQNQREAAETRLTDYCHGQSGQVKLFTCQWDQRRENN